jgi:hypothetical protein
MPSPNFGSRPLSQLPASAFPERADRYVCDKCGRDISKHFRGGRAHAQKPMGAERYLCRCGQKYLTGAIEWNHLGEWERARRVRDTFGLGILFSAMFSILGLLAFLVLRFIFDLRKGALIISLVITAFPFVLMQMTFWPDVVRSMWRTGVGPSVTGPD